MSAATTSVTSATHAPVTAQAHVLKVALWQLFCHCKPFRGDYLFSRDLAAGVLDDLHGRDGDEALLLDELALDVVGKHEL